MKKVLIIALVLGIASTADALILELGAGGVTNGPGSELYTELHVVRVVSDSDATPYEAYLLAPDTTIVDFASITALPGAGPDATVVDYGDAFGAATHLYAIRANDLSPPLDSIQAGIQFEVTRKGYPGSFLLYSEDMTLLDSVTFVPEPATMLLIGLGGLFVRRRR